MAVCSDKRSQAGVAEPRVDHSHVVVRTGKMRINSHCLVQFVQRVVETLLAEQFIRFVELFARAGGNREVGD